MSERPIVDDLELAGTSRLNDTGGSGTLTLPKSVTESMMAKHGQDYAIFSDGTRILVVPNSEVRP